MPALSILATQLHTGASRTKSITIAGLEVNAQPTAGGNGYHVPFDSIEVDEQGPGGVSRMTFALVDPLAAAPLGVPSDGDEIQYWDLTNGVPLFAGWVSTWAVKVLPSGIGRVTTVQCVGFEAILDWAVIPTDLLIASGTRLYTAIQSCAGIAEGVRSLRAFSNPPGASSQAYPVASFFSSSFPTTQYDVSITAGTTLREALATVAQSASSIEKTRSTFATVPANIQFSVDFYRGLRAMPDSASGAWATDYVGLTVTDTAAGVLAAHDLEDETDATQIVRGVFVKGANAAGTGFLGDGTGKPGRIAYISDTSIDTAAKLLDAQATYLNQFVIARRGSFHLDDTSPTPNVRPGSLLTLTDAITGATGTHRIYQITKRFLKSGRETWELTYGGLRASRNRLLRRLTRTIRS